MLFGTCPAAASLTLGRPIVKRATFSQWKQVNLSCSEKNDLQKAFILFGLYE